MNMNMEHVRPGRPRGPGWRNLGMNREVRKVSSCATVAACRRERVYGMEPARVE